MRIPEFAGRCAAVSLFALIFLSGGVSEALPAQPFKVKSTVLVPGCKVDASALAGPEVDGNLKKNLEKIPFGFISQPLGEITLTKEQIRKLLGDLTRMFELPRNVQFVRRGEILAGAELAQRIGSACRSDTSGFPSDEIRIDFSRLPGNVLLPGPLVSWNLRPMSSNRFGMRLFTVEADCTGGSMRQIVQVDVWREFKGAKTTHLLKPGATIRPSDVVPETIRLRNESAAAPIPFGDVIGRRVAAFKSMGTMIRSSDLECPGPSGNCRSSNPAAFKNCVTPVSPGKGPVIRPGDKVDFLVRSGELNLMVPAKALQSGSPGDSIRLLNLQNNRQITGVITPDGKVEHAKN